MNEQCKLILALQQVDNLISLTQGNQYQSYLHFNLIIFKVELERQMNLLTNTNIYSKIKESN